MQREHFKEQYSTRAWAASVILLLIMWSTFLFSTTTAAAKNDDTKKKKAKDTYNWMDNEASQLLWEPFCELSFEYVENDDNSP